MLQGQSRKWLTAFVSLMVAGTPSARAQQAKAPDTYAVTEVNSLFGPVTTMEISRDGNRAVVDQTAPRDGTGVLKNKKPLFIGPFQLLCIIWIVTWRRHRSRTGTALGPGIFFHGYPLDGIRGDSTILILV